MRATVIKAHSFPSEKQKSARGRANMRHNAAVLHVGITLKIDIARSPIINNALVALIDIFLTAIVHGFRTVVGKNHCAER